MTASTLDGFALALACWCALAVGGVLPVADASPPVVAVGGGLAALVVVASATRVHLASAVATRRLHYALVTLPIGAGVLLAGADAVALVDLGVPEQGPAADPAVGVALVVGIGLAVVGGVAAVLADNRYAARRRREERGLVSWRAPAEEVHRKWMRRSYVVVAAAAAVLGVVVVAVTRSSAGLLLFSFAAAVGAVAVTTVDRTGTYTALEEGVVVGVVGAVREQYVPYARFAGYRVTDDALVLERRLPGTSVHCSLDAVEDREDGVAVLDDRLG
jgi:hypothetical protein